MYNNNNNNNVYIYIYIPDYNLLKHFQHEYFNRYPKGLNPVQNNDIFFSLHAVFATIVTVGQCFIYEVIKCDLNYVS